MIFKKYFNKKITSEIKYILLLFIVTRIALTIIGISSNMILELIQDDKVTYSNLLRLDIWGQWDSGYYLSIAEEGYSPAISTNTLTLNQANYGFFPLYPLLMKIIGGIIGNNYIAGIIISNVSLIIACIFLFKLVRLESNTDTAYKSVKYLFLFPTAFIFSAVLSESLFLALIIMCFYYAKQRNWLLAGIMGFLLSLTRPIGVFVILPLVYDYIKSGNVKNHPSQMDVLYLLLIPFGFFIFMAYIYFLTGDFLSYFHMKQAGWGHVLSNPFKVLFANSYRADIFRSFNGWFTLAIALFLTINYKKIGFSGWMLSMLLIFIPLASGSASIYSMLRYMLPIFPLFILFGKLAKNNHFDQFATIFLAMLQGFLMVFWSNGFYLIV